MSTQEDRPRFVNGGIRRRWFLIATFIVAVIGVVAVFGLSDREVEAPAGFHAVALTLLAGYYLAMTYEDDMALSKAMTALNDGSAPIAWTVPWERFAPVRRTPARWRWVTAVGFGAAYALFSSLLMMADEEMLSHPDEAFVGPNLAWGAFDAVWVYIALRIGQVMRPGARVPVAIIDEHIYVDGVLRPMDSETVRMEKDTIVVGPTNDLRIGPRLRIPIAEGLEASVGAVVAEELGALG